VTLLIDFALVLLAGIMNRFALIRSEYDFQMNEEIKGPDLSGPFQIRQVLITAKEHLTLIASIRT